MITHRTIVAYNNASDMEFLVANLTVFLRKNQQQSHLWVQQYKQDHIFGSQIKKSMAINQIKFL